MDTETIEKQALNNGKTFVWHEVYGPSSQVSIDFYTKALDFGSTEMDMGEMGKYHMLTRNGQGVAGVISTQDNPQLSDVPPHWSTYISVEDVDVSLAKCLEHGASIEVPPIDVPTIGRMALIKDPQGAHVWIFTPQR